MEFQWRMTLGDLATILAVLSGAVAVYMRLIERLARIETKVDALWAHYMKET